ncbi:MAG: hypothetical protein ABIK83_14700 [Candidatus Zixiibacteriota bacterium]
MRAQRISNGANKRIKDRVGDTGQQQKTALPKRCGFNGSAAFFIENREDLVVAEKYSFELSGSIMNGPR